LGADSCEPKELHIRCGHDRIRSRKGQQVGDAAFCQITLDTCYYISNADNFLTLYKADINAICELLAVKHGDMESDLFSNSVLDAFIE